MLAAARAALRLQRPALHTHLRIVATSSLRLAEPHSLVRLSVRLFRTDALLERLETEANKNPHDISKQNQLLRELNKQDFHEDVKRRFESGRYSFDNAGRAEYLLALMALDKANTATIQKLLNSTPSLTPSAAGDAAYLPPLRINFDSPIPVEMTTTKFSNLMTVISRILTILFGAVLLGSIYKFVVNNKNSPAGGGVGILGMPNAHHTATKPDVRFSDVLGIDEAKAELAEIVEYLRNREKFTAMGAKLPKGVLLYGSPGTGKTLLAKAIAGEAGVPFLFTSGAEFDEVFVGVGSRRVRNLFEEAKKNAPCIVFVDEIDAIGFSRNRPNAGTTYKDNTLNQLLSEMDGFKQNEGVIVIGATNLPEALDPALLRPGRFDKIVNVPLPDVRGRKLILEHYLKKIVCNSEIDTTRLAKSTPGLSGADLANIVNLAAIKAAIRGVKEVTTPLLEEAYDDVTMGVERRSAVIPEDSRKLTAYHEGGHALVSIYTEGASAIRKATIVPRGQALGMVAQIPEELKTSRKKLTARVAVCMGGRAAEELIFGKQEVTPGAQSDFQQATELAHNMVTKWGMSDRIGTMFIRDESSSRLSTDTRKLVEEEVTSILNAQYTHAKKVLSEHLSELHLLAQALLEHETLTGEEINEIIKGKKIRT